MRRRTGRSAGLLCVAFLLSLALAGCSGPPEAAIDVSHVHGVAYDPWTGNLYLATHHGLARGEPTGDGWTWSYVGDPFDYMGFTQDANRSEVFYTSGHPDDPRAFGGVHLGLRRSTDGGETWEQRSLKGEVDFHALTALHGGEGWLAGAWQGKVKVSRDAGATWTDFNGPPATVVALAASSGALWAGTSGGLHKTTDLQALTQWTLVDGPVASLVSSVAVSSDGANLLAGTGNGRTGATYRSTDGGATWSPLADPGLADAAAQVHFTFDKGEATHAFAALADGRVLETHDAGATWSKVR